MKKAFFTLAIVLLAVAAQAQIKVHDDGHVSLGSLTQTYGVQIHPLDYTSFRSSHSDEWSWIELSMSNVANQKHWIVNNLSNANNPHPFFVTTTGAIHNYRCYRVADDSFMCEIEHINGAGALLENITGVWYFPINEGKSTKTSERHAGVSAQEVKSVLPEAVTSDENGLLYVDYEVLTVILIEAIKEQRNEITKLRKDLEENGFLEPQKP